MLKSPVRRLLTAIILLVLPGLLSTPWLAAGQNAPAGASRTPSVVATPAEADLSHDQLNNKRAEIQASSDLAKESRDSAIKLLDQAIAFRKSFDDIEQQSQALSQQINTAPQRLKLIQSELAKPIQKTEAVKSLAARKNALELEQKLQKEKAQLTAAKDAQAGWSDQIKRLKDFLERLPQNIATAKERLRAVGQELQTRPNGSESETVSESRRLMLLAEELKLKAEIKLYEQQLNGYDLLLSLAMAERELAAREVTRGEELTKAWQAEVSDKVQEDAAKLRQEAEKAKDRAPEMASALKDQYDINIAFSAELEQLAGEVTEVTKTLEEVHTQLKQIEEDFELATARVEALVLTETIGLALRRQRQMLPTGDSYRQGSAERKLKMGEVRETLYQLERRRRGLTDIEAETDKILDSLVYLTPEAAEGLRLDVRDLLINRQQLLDRLQSGYNQYFKILQNTEFAEQQLVAKAEEYADFLDTHLVWIRSSSIISLTDFKNSAVVLRELVRTANWRLVISDLVDSFTAKTGLWLLGLLLMAVLLIGRRWARSELTKTAEKVNKRRKDSFSLTIWKLGLTVYLTIGFPYIMIFVAWQLQQLPGSYDFTRAIATGLLSAGLVLAGFRFLYHLCRRDGLAHIHFKWNESIRQTLLKNLRWVTPVGVVMGFLVSAVTTVKEIEFGDSLARLAFTVQMVAVSVFFGWILRFSGGIVMTLLHKHPTGWLARLRYIWWPVAVGMPLFMAVMATSGYFLSAIQLRDLIEASFLLVMILIVLNSLALRWLALARRRFAIREAQRKAEEKREENLRKQAEEMIPGTEESGPVVIHPEPEIGLAEIDGQTRSLLRTIMFFLVAIGIWAIWEPVFPAFGILQDIHLWSYSGIVDGVATDIPISLANLLMAVVVAVITFIASRNLPGLLEITILNRLPMDAGARHAFTTICRYAITAIGIILVFNTIGFRWSSVQWLIAALGVGLGFGLQEIVANFVCGLIVLFERPFRVGDTVTIGDVSGTVSRIRIRATTILDWDRKELIVPNKEFITGRLVNWSLSDPISRFIVKVGIAYGSDVELAEKLLLKVLNGNPLVLKEPKPSAYFLGFGDSSLNFELRVYISTIDHWLPTRHEIHKAIDREFRKAGIVISFPQRDVHFDADQPLKVQMVPDKAGKTPDDPEPEPQPPD